MRWVYSFLVLCVACSGGDGDAGKKPVSVDGSVTVAGEERSVAACAITGTGIDRALVMTLDDGAVITAPIHERDLYYSAGGDGRGDKLECTTASDGSSSDVWFEGNLAYACKGATEVEIELAIECGTKGPSNQKPDQKK